LKCWEGLKNQVKHAGDDEQSDQKNDADYP
jgi:hypothetical protein